MTPTEHDEQVSLVAWFRAQYPGVLIFAIPNGAALAGGIRRRSAQMNSLKSEGLVPGIPDLFIPAWKLFVEMKRAKGGVVSDAQKNIHEQLAPHFPVIVAHGFDDGVEKLKEYANSVAYAGKSTYNCAADGVLPAPTASLTKSDNVRSPDNA